MTNTRTNLGNYMTADTKGATLLVDGSLTPCWSWKDAPELYSGKHKTTGHNIQVVSDLRGQLVYLSAPLPGKTQLLVRKYR